MTTTILETVENISDNIQETFTELIKLVLRKTIRPALNPLGRNTRVLYNSGTNRYERGFVGHDPSDNINKYTYHMVSDTLGWTSNNDVLFKISPKSMPRQIISRGIVRGQLSRSSAPSTALFPNRINPFFPSNNSGRIHNMCFKKFTEHVIARTSVNTNSGIKTEFVYSCAMTYTDGFVQLNSIGQDIINQTDASIDPQDSARMSTALLRVKLFNLERILVFFLSNYPDLYAEYIDMVRLINSENTSNTISIISLIGTLTVVSWDNLAPSQQQAYINRLGQKFINDFNSNKLITILLKTNTPELILTTSYLYSLLKMLYSVFGYDKLVPNLFVKGDQFYNSDECCFPIESIRKYNNKNRGAFTTRSYIDEHEGCEQTCEPICEPIYRCLPDCVPPSECTYNFIRVFNELYPTITEIMGGTIFPTPCQNLSCCDIPPNYCNINSIPSFLLRFTEFSYCAYLEYIDSKQVHNALGANIDNKIRYLKTF